MSKEQLYELTVINKDTELTVDEKVLGWEIYSGAIEIRYVNGVVHVFELGQSGNEKAFSFTPVKD